MPYAKRSALSPLSVRIYAFRLLTGSVSRRPGLPSPLLRLSLPLLAPFQCYHHPFYVLLRAAVNMNIWIMSLISMFPPLTYFVASRRWRRISPPPPSLPLPLPLPPPPHPAAPNELCWRRQQQHGREQLSARYFDGRRHRAGRTDPSLPPA